MRSSPDSLTSAGREEDSGERLPVAVQNSYGAARKNTPTATILTVRSSRKGTGVIALSRRTQFTIAA